jgi:hypothetical protein
VLRVRGRLPLVDPLIPRGDPLELEVSPARQQKNRHKPADAFPCSHATL